jgi:hypothetical protein
LSDLTSLFAFLSPDSVIHILVVVLSITVLVIALLAYERKKNTRFMLLSFAFMFLAASQIITLFETLFLSGSLVLIPIVNIHLTHIFDFFTLLTFGFALVRDWDQRKPEVLKIANR